LVIGEQSEERGFNTESTEEHIGHREEHSEESLCYFMKMGSEQKLAGIRNFNERETARCGGIYGGHDNGKLWANKPPASFAEYHYREVTVI
jgi:hypothetical protein